MGRHKVCHPRGSLLARGRRTSRCPTRPGRALQTGWEESASAFVCQPALFHGGTRMKKVLPYLGAALSLLAATWTTSAKAQDQTFKDVESSHWAYQAVTDLQQKGILTGYPDGYFRGKRTLTRYEFAIALERALKSIPQVQGPPGPQGEAGPAGPPGPPGMTPEEVQELRRLTDEFKNELAALGNNVRDINNRLD